MQLKLKGENFKIESLNNEVQILKDKNITDWNWDITPLKSGLQQLVLLISAKIKLTATGSDMQDLPIEERLIKVHVNPTYSIKTFLSKNWQWIIGTLLGSGVVITKAFENYQLNLRSFDLQIWLKLSLDFQSRRSSMLS